MVGPFGIFDTRAYLTQSIFNWKSIQQTRSDAQQIRAAQFSYKDARELVVFAVASAYLQTIADSARVETAAAQQDTALALYQQAEDPLKAGTTAAIDVLRARVELQNRRQQVISARNELAKQKIVLGRVVGLPTGQEFMLTSTTTYTPPPKVSLDEALSRAYASRADYQSALAQVRAAELARRAAVAGYYPSVSAAVNYGDIGHNPGNSHGTLQATAALRQSRELSDNLRAQIDQDVRNAFLDMQSAADQVEVARDSVDLANQTLIQARDRFSAGVTDNIEVVQAQQSVASANESLISSLYAYNASKVELRRAIGNAEAGVQEHLRGTGLGLRVVRHHRRRGANHWTNPGRVDHFQLFLALDLLYQSASWRNGGGPGLSSDRRSAVSEPPQSCRRQAGPHRDRTAGPGRRRLTDPAGQGTGGRLVRLAFLL